MSFDSSGEVYLLPFRPSNEHKFNELCGKKASLNLSESDVSEDLFEIRITGLTPDFNDVTFQQSRPRSGTTSNDVMTTVKHQEIDLETLNLLISKEVVSRSAVRSDTPCISQTCMKSDLSVGQVRESSSLPIVMYAKDLCVFENDDQSDIEVLDNLRMNNDISLGTHQDNLLLYSNDGNVLNSVQVLGLDNTDESMWVSDSKLFALPGDSFDSDGQISQEIDLGNTLVPVKVEDGVVYINAAPSSCDSLKIGDWNVKDKMSIAENSPPDDTCVQSRPSVISVVTKSLEHMKDQCKGSSNTRKITSNALNEDVKQSSSFPSPLLNKSGFHSLFKPKFVSSKNSRSVLKASVTGGQKVLGSMKGKYEISALKEEPLNSSLSANVKGMDSKSMKLKFSRSKVKKPQSLAVVAISSDKTKDLTEIVVSTSKGEQIFKGKTSELISATPSLWCVNNAKVDIPSPSNADYMSSSQDMNSQDDDEQIDDKPVTDALRRLGIPALKWIQKKPEDERMWFCPEKDCKRLFPRLHMLKVHILGHYGVRPYRCDFPNCQWAFYTHFKLKRHKETHLQRKDFKCPVPDCGRSFSTIYNLNTHQKLHKRPAEITCPVENCSELFQTRRSLEFHLRQHGTDHAPYVCPYSSCQKRYYTVNSVNSHIRSHQHKDDEIRCQWAGCSKVFNKPCRLKAHMRTHTGDKPYPCNHPGCNWAFSSSSKLKRHQHKHTNVRNFECPLEGCGKLFMRSEHLKEHILTHSSERTFKCPHPNCNVKFSAKSSLYVHSKKHKAKLLGVPATELSVDITAPISVNVIKSPVNSDEKVDNNVEELVSIVKIESEAPLPVDIFMCPVQHCGRTFLSVLDMREHVDQTHSLAAPIEIPASAQSLDLIPLLSEDEALVAELASMDPVPFTNETVSSLRTEDAALCSSSLESESNVMSGISEFMDDTGNSNNLEGVVSSALDGDDLDLVLNPASARSSITLNSWMEFKKHRLRQGTPLKHLRQSKRPVHQLHRVKKNSPVIQNLDDDHTPVQLGRTSANEGLSNLRAPLDVVLGAGLLGSGLLLPDDLAASSDMYSGEDGILSMDSSFVPSTINLRDLE